MTHLIYPNTSPVESIGVFMDVDLISNPPQEGYALLWDDINEKWKPTSITVTIQTTDDLPEGNTNFYYTNTRIQNYLSSVAIETFNNVDSNLDKSDNNILKWDNNQLISVPISIPNLGISDDVNLSVLSDGQVLVWDFDQGLWIPQTLPIPETTTDLPEGNNLYHTSSRVSSVINSSSLNSLSNIDESGKEIGDQLSWNGSFWIPKPLTSNPPESGDMMMWDGSEWVAAKPKDLNYIETSSNITIAPNTICGVDSNGEEITITLPESPIVGDKIVIFDLAGSDPLSPTGFGLNKVSILPSLNQTIQGYDSLDIKEENISLGLVYSSNKDRWSIYLKT